MYCTKKITDDLVWVGANDRRLMMFEGVYDVPNGMSYNSYLLMDEKTTLFDTVDKAVSKRFFENLNYTLAGRDLNYVIVEHVEPDHCATLEELVLRYPNVKVVCNAKALNMIKQFFEFDIESKSLIVKEGEELNTGKHKLSFINAPMVHWPEVMMVYDKTDEILFSADAFGSFGALNGAIFADEVDFYKDYLDEARRYYCNIVGKYGPSVQMVLKKALNLNIKMICPLHGLVWRKNLNDITHKYNLWSKYEAEEKGVLIAYASIYGNTENLAEIIASKLQENKIKTTMFDVSSMPKSYIIANAFKYSHLIFASCTYNAGIFVKMEELLRDLVAHNIQNKTVALIENGSWAPTAAKQMREILNSSKNINILGDNISIKSSVKENTLDNISKLVENIKQSFI